MARLVGLGHCVMDQLLLVERYPALDSKNTARQRRISGGGPVPTALVAAARLGCECHFSGQVGDDPLGQAILASLQEEGVRTGSCSIRPGCRSPLASIWVEARSARRTVVLDRGDLPPLEEADLPALELTEGDLLLLDGKDPVCLAAARQAKEAGARVLLDLGGERDNPQELIGLSDLVIVSKEFLLSAYPEVELFQGADLLRELGPSFAAITMGPGGLVYSVEDRSPTWFPAWPGTGKVLDSTGAGDAFHGAFAWGLLEGLSFAEALKAGAICGGRACRELGGRSSLPDGATLRQDMADWKI